MSSSIINGWDKISREYQEKMKIPVDNVYWGDFVAPESQLKVLGNVKGKRILEIGCGGAQNSIALSKWGAEAFGIDFSKKQILYGKRLAEKEGINVYLIVGNLEDLPFINESFDVVTTAISLHYVPDLNAAVAEVHEEFLQKMAILFLAPVIL